VKLFADVNEELRKQIKKFTIIFLIVAIIFFAIVQTFDLPSEVSGLYFEYAEKMASLQMPYSDFPAEYPPLAMLLIFIPRLFSFSPFTYEIAFGVMVYIALLAGLICTYKLADMYSDKPRRYTDLYIILCMCFFEFIMDRYDIFPTMICLFALYFFKTNRMNLAWVMIAIGTMTKLFPALLAPVFLIYLCMNGRGRDALKGVGICVAIGIASMLPFFISDPETMFMFLTYHMDRGMQTESLVSSFLMLFDKIGIIDIGYQFNYGSDHIYGPVPDAIAGVMLYIMIVLIVATYIMYGTIVHKIEEKDAFLGIILASFVVVMLFILVNKVLSSQYIIWMIPFVVIACAIMDPVWEKRTEIMFACALALTQLAFAVNMGSFAPSIGGRIDATSPYPTLGILLLVIRNITLVALLGYMTKGLLSLGHPGSGVEIAGQHDPIKE